MPKRKPGPSWSKSVPIDLWPALDQASWEAALRPGDVLEPGGVASRWSPATRRKTALGYGRFLFFLLDRGELDPTVAPADRVTPKRLAAYLVKLKSSNRGHTIQNRIQELGDAMRALAPESDWRWLLRAAGRLRASAIPAQDKRARLRPIAELVAQGFRMMEAAHHKQGLSDLGRAALYRDGLLMAFLGSHPLRLRNLAALRIGHHLVEQGEELVLRVDACETKGHRPYEAVLGPRLSLALRRYLHHHRPVLLQAKGRWHTPAGNAFWISRDGSPCSEETFSNIIRKHTRGPGRLPLSPHLFRSCAATSIAVEAPSSVDIIPAILTHGSPKTGERYYNLASSLEASRAHSRMLEALRQELAPRPDHRRLDRDQRPERGARPGPSARKQP